MKIATVSLGLALLFASWPAFADATAPSATRHYLPAPSASPADLTMLPTPTNRVSKEGDTVSVTFAVSHEPGIKYEELGLPPGLTLDPATGAVTGQLAPLSAGDYAVLIRASTGTTWETITFYWTVLDVTLPQLASPGVQVNTAGDTVSLQLVGSSTRTDQLSYDALGLPSGLAIDKATGKITGKIADHDARTTYYVTATVYDGNVMGGAVFTWIVLPNK